MANAEYKSVDDLLTGINKLLMLFGITNKPILDIEEILRNASSMMVALIENLFQSRVEFINRFPRNIEDYTKNAQLVIDYLSDRTEMDLGFITGQAIANGEEQSILNLINILIKIVHSGNEASMLATLNEVFGQAWAKPLMSIEEFCRNSSSIFVTLFESIFDILIDDVNRDPTSKDDFIHNAQLVVNLLEDHIQMDLGHIRGKDIVDENKKTIFNLVDIFIRIISITSQDVSLSSIETSESLREEGEDRLDESSSSEQLSVNINDTTYYAGRSPWKLHKYNRVDAEPQTDAAYAKPNTVKRTRMKLKQLDMRVRQEQATKRKEKLQFSKVDSVRKANSEKKKVSRRVMEQKNKEDLEMQYMSYCMQRESLDLQELRQVQNKIMQVTKEYNIDARHQYEESLLAQKEQWRSLVEAQQRSFEGELNMLEEQINEMKRGRIVEQREIEEEHRRSLRETKRVHDHVLMTKKDHLKHQQEKELLRRSESHKKILTDFISDRPSQRNWGLPRLYRRRDKMVAVRAK